MTRQFLPVRPALIKCAEHPTIDGATPEGATCRAGHPEVKTSWATFRATTEPAGEMEQPGRPPIRLGHCLRCGSTLTWVDPGPADDVTETAVMIWQVRR